MNKVVHLIKHTLWFFTKTKKRKIFSIFLLIIVIWGAYYWFSSENGSVQIRETIAKVELWNIEKTIKVVGSAELVDEQELRFNQQWDVVAVYFKEWDAVKKWDIIAKLDSETAENSIKQAQISLENAQIDLQDVLEGSTNIELMQAQNNLDVSQNNLIIAQEEYDKLLVEQATTLQEKEDALVLAKEEINIESKITGDTVVLSKTLTDTMNTIREYISDSEDLLDDVDAIFGVSDENKDKNDDFELYLSAKNASLKGKVSSLWTLLSSKQESISENYDLLKSSDITQENLWILLADMSSLYERMIDLWDYAVSATSMSVSCNFYSESEINSDISSMTQVRSQSQNNFSKIQDIIDSIANSDISFQKTVNSYESLKSDLDQLKTDYEIKIKSKENEITNLQTSIAINIEKLEDVEDWATEREVLLAQNSVVKAELSLENAKKTLENYQIEASFDWALRKIDFKVWDKLTSDENKYVYLENPNLVQMTAKLDQIDIVSVKEGQNVRIVFDAYEDLTLTGIVSEIDSTPLTNSNVVSYQISVDMDKWDLDIYGGMTATMYIIIEGKDNLLLVPSSYIQQKWNKNIILVKTGTWDVKQQEVEVWITDEIQTEIISGVSEWDIVIKQVSVSSSDEETSATAKFPMLWWGDGWGWTRPSWGPGM